MVSTGTVVCPQCGRVAEVELGAHPFCRQCDYPLFWQLPRDRPAAAPVASTSVAPITSIPCPSCRRRNDDRRTYCEVCGATLRTTRTRVRRTWIEPQELAAPPSRRRRIVTRLAVVLALLALLVVAAVVALYVLVLRRSPWQLRTLDIGQATWDISQTTGLDGLPLITYVDGADLGLRVLKCATATCDATQSQNTITRVDSVGQNGQGQGTAIAIGTDGRPVLSFRDAAARALVVLHCGDPNCTDPGAITRTQLDPPKGSADQTLDAGAASSIAIGTDGMPIISYHDAGLGTLKVAHCANAACTHAQITTIVQPTGSSATAGVGAASKIRIGADGLPLIVFRDDGKHALELVRCSDQACTHGAIVTLVQAPDLQPGYETSMVLDAQGRPVIAYHDKSNDGIYVVHCDDVACSHVTRTAVDTNGFHSEPSIALDRSGLPVLAYRETPAGNETGKRLLRFVRCSDLACAQHTSPQLVDGAQRTGYSPSILVLPNGKVTIAYGDATLGALKYAAMR